MPDLTGQTLADYRVLRRLGQGAMAEVYLAQQVSLARQVALKVLSPELASDASYVTRFQHEAQAAAALVHASIVQIYEVGCAGGYHFIAQEYVAGRNLGDEITRSGPLPPGQVLDILRQVAAALQKAAERGIVHRDIKPENILLARSGEVKVADFGLARAGENNGANLTQAGVTMGTPLYMSPEQIEGHAVDPRSDLYSLGVTAYHMLAGRPPFGGDTPLSVAVQHLNKPPPPLADAGPDLPLGLTRIVDRLLAKKPDVRFASPAALLADLHALAKQAAGEGWAEGPENWSIAEMGLVSGGAAEATNKLGELMKAESRFAQPARRWGRIALVAGAAVGVGGLLAALTSPPSLLADARDGTIEKADVVRQTFHAKMVDTPDAWRAVRSRFPDADPYYLTFADQNLVRLYLRREQYDAAARICRQLANLGDNQQPLRLFGLAGVVVCQQQLGNRPAAERALSQFPMAQVEVLREVDPQMATLFFDAKSQLNGNSQ